MQVLNSELEQLIYFRDTQHFVEEDLSSYDLCIQFSESFIRIFVSNHKDARCLYLESIDFAKIISESYFLNKLESIYHSHQFLEAGFWKSIRISVKSQNFTLIPANFYNENCKEEYFKLNCNFNSQSTLFSYKHSESEIINLFSVQESIVNFFKNKYPLKKPVFFHHTSALIEVFLRNNPNEVLPTVFVVAEKDMITILVKKKKSLLFCNNFSYQTPEDMLYFIASVMDELKIDNTSSKLVLWGEVFGSGSLQMPLVSKYLPQFQLGYRPNQVKFGFDFDELEEQRFIDLLAMIYCS